MKFHKLFLLSASAALLSAGCSDDFLSDDNNGWINDGAIRFNIQESGISTRSGGTELKTINHINSQLTVSKGDSIWFHFYSTENTEFSSASENTRSMPISAADFDKFELSARVCNGSDATSESSRFFFNGETFTVKGSSATPEDGSIYYWPQSDALNFYGYCDMSVLQPTTGHKRALNISDNDLSKSKITFDYAVPTDNQPDAVRNDADIQPDFMLTTLNHSKAKVQAEKKDPTLSFWHPLAGIAITVGELKHHTPTRIEIKGLYSRGTCTFDCNGAANDKFYSSKWDINKSAGSTTYIQNNLRDMEIPGISGTALCPPFLVLPHAQIPEDATIKVYFENEEPREVSLAKLGVSLEAGKILNLKLSLKDEQYPPVENLQGMAGNNTLTLSWEDPIFKDNRLKEYIHQVGVRIKVSQYPTGDDSVIYEYIAPYDASKRQFPNPEELIWSKIFEQGIDTYNNDNFHCVVTPVYYNEDDNELHSGEESFIDLGRKNTNTIVGFYIPEGGLLDDDDVAAYEWFISNYKGNARIVTKDNILEEQKKGMNVVWFSCGVSLSNNKTQMHVNPNQGNEDYSEVRDANAIITNAENDELFKNCHDYNYMMSNRDELRRRFLDEKDAILKRPNKFSGLYNDPNSGAIKSTNPDNYVSQADEKAIADFYRRGGNLLLTSFAITKIYEFHVVPDNNFRDWNEGDDYPTTPHYSQFGDGYLPHRPNLINFNEVKQPSMWFIRADFGGRNNNNHPIFAGIDKNNAAAPLFKTTREFFTENIYDLPDDGNQNAWRYSGDSNDPYGSYWIAASRKVTMFPLLSMDSFVCENNNVVWDFTGSAFPIGDGNSSMEKVEAECNARFLATWGQLSDTSVGVAIEFYPGKTHVNSDGSAIHHSGTHYVNTTHGRCICIGLGAYEFNNGTKYSRGANILNKYQTNVQQLTQNIIEYLNSADDNVKAPGYGRGRR